MAQKVSHEHVAHVPVRSKTFKRETIKAFRQIPGVGESIAEDFWNLGLRSLDDLVGADPEALYKAICEHHGCQVDRCMLYVFRCAVYYATETNHDPEKLKWWNWKEPTH